MTSIENVFEQLEEQGLVFKSANNLLHISIDASDYLDIKRLSIEMHKQEIIDAWKDGAYGGGQFTTTHETSEQYYQETFVSKVSDDHISDISKMVEVPQQEISDTEIEFAGTNAWVEYNLTVSDDAESFYAGWKLALKWYREQLKLSASQEK